MTSRVVVTGGGSGIGRAIAEDLARQGHLVTIVDVNDDDARRTSEGLEGDGHDAIVGDVAEREIHHRAADLSPQLVGWVNCAGITMETPMNDPDEARVRRLVDVNQLGSYWGCSAAVGRFLRQGNGGSIVNISSIHGRMGAADFGAYEMTKAAIEALTRNVAVTYGGSGIRANAVAPGAVMTPALMATVEATTDPSATVGELAKLAPLRRIADPGEIATVVRFLLSSDASYLTGQSIAVDGGWSVALGISERSPGSAR